MTIEARRRFHDDLDQLCSDVVLLAGMAGESIQAGTAALLDSDLARAEAVVEHDIELDRLCHSIEQRCYALMAQQQPMAGDLRTLVTTLRAIHELERIGDLMVKIAKATRRLFPHQLEPRVRGLFDRMRAQATAELRVAADAFADRDPARSAALADMDDVMDDLQKELFRTIFSTGELDDRILHMSVQVALVGRFYERVADHAVNFGERVRFMVTGEVPYSLDDLEGVGGAAQR
ncbi:MAG TPA: phosphate signaling complex protein PhoU [Acidimicrobiales bacterium]|nr:phosphate signaling complex protein PhoU [Acidimicrobiales bacterium]